MIGFDSLRMGRLRARYKRFFADIALDTGETITAHCPNPGKMLGLLDDNTPALVTHIGDPKKKLQYRLEALQANNDFGGTWVGVNTQWPNRLVHKAIAARRDSAIGRICFHKTGSKIWPEFEELTCWRPATLPCPTPL